MADFDIKDENDGADAMDYLWQIKINWDQEDPEFFFIQFENRLKMYSIHKQWSKRMALINCLPYEVGKEFRHLVMLQEAEAGDTPYKTLKDAVMEAYGPRPGDRFTRAMNRVMMSTWNPLQT